MAKRIESSPDGTRSGPFPLVLFSCSEGDTACAAPPERRSSISLVGELQYILTKNAVAKLNMGVGVTKKEGADLRAGNRSDIQVLETWKGSRISRDK